MLVDEIELSEAEIKDILDQNARLRAENAAIKQDIQNLKGAIVKVMVGFGFVDQNMQPLKLNKFKIALKVKDIVLDAIDGVNNSVFTEVIEIVKPMIEKYKDL